MGYSCVLSYCDNRVISVLMWHTFLHTYSCALLMLIVSTWCCFSCDFFAEFCFWVLVFIVMLVFLIYAMKVEMILFALFFHDERGITLYCMLVVVWVLAITNKLERQ